MTHLQVEKNSSYPHGLTDFQVIGAQREARRALIVGRQNFNVDRSDGAPGEGKDKRQFIHCSKRVDRLLFEDITNELNVFIFTVYIFTHIYTHMPNKPAATYFKSEQLLLYELG